MQPPSEADVVAATDSLKRQKLALDRQIEALEGMASVFGEDDAIPPFTGSVSLDINIARFLRAYRDQRFEDAQALGSAIAHNERALQAYRSGIVLPAYRGPRKPTN